MLLSGGGRGVATALNSKIKHMNFYTQPTINWISERVNKKAISTKKNLKSERRSSFFLLSLYCYVPGWGIRMPNTCQSRVPNKFSKELRHLRERISAFSICYSVTSTTYLAHTTEVNPRLHSQRVKLNFVQCAYVTLIGFLLKSGQIRTCRSAAGRVWAASESASYWTRTCAHRCSSTCSPGDSPRFAYSLEPSCTRVQPGDIPTTIYWLVQEWSTYRSDLSRFCSWWISNRAFFGIFAKTIARFLHSY